MLHRYASCSGSREQFLSWDWGSVSYSLHWWSAQGSHRPVWETAHCGESPEALCWVSRPLQLENGNCKFMILVIKVIKISKKTICSEQYKCQNTGAAPEDMGLGWGSEDGRIISQDPRSEADHKSHTSLYLHNNAPRQQLMTTPCEAIMEDTRETRGQRRGRGQLSAIHHHFMRYWILTTWFVSGHEVREALGPTDDGGGKQLGGKSPRVLLEEHLWNKVSILGLSLV